MEGKYPYFETITTNDTLQIDDIGNCFIRCGNDISPRENYLCIRTDADGVVTVMIEKGIIPGESGCQVGWGVSCSVRKFIFARNIIDKQIKDFLRGATWADTVSSDYVQSNTVDLPSCFFRG